MYAEDDLIQLSALQHYVFCKRQCALIHIEQLWAENYFTASGRIMHERVHENEQECGNGVRIERGRAVRSLELGIIGKMDVVEFHLQEPDKWRAYPVEYKRGKTKIDDCDRVQLCAQALCLEEEFGTEIPEGAIFYGRSRRREYVEFSVELRVKTKKICKEIHQFIQRCVTPLAVYTQKCVTCSLNELCMPQKMNKRSIADYLDVLRNENEKTS